MTTTLYFSRNPNPRLAVAVARHLAAPVSFQFAEPLAPGQAERYRHLNPSLRLPILAEEGGSLWEADAIACRLSQMVGSDFWRNGDLGEYLVPVQADVPRIEVLFVGEPDPSTAPLGIKSVGEIGITGVAAAIANAVYNATGRRLRDLPLDLRAS